MGDEFARLFGGIRQRETLLHAEGAKDLAIQIGGKGLARDALDNGAQQIIADIAILEFLTRCAWQLTQRGECSDEICIGGCIAACQQLVNQLVGIVGQPRSVMQQLAHGDRICPSRQFGQIGADRGVIVEFARLVKLHDRNGGKLLAHRTDVKDMARGQGTCLL